MNKLPASGSIHFGKVEVFKDYRPDKTPYPFNDQVLDAMAESTVQKPVRVLNTYVADDYDGWVRPFRGAVKTFKVTGKRHLRTLSKLVKAYHEEQAKIEAAKAQGSPIDITERNKYGQAITEFLFKKARLPLGLSPEKFRGEAIWCAGFEDKKYEDMKDYAEVFETKTGRPWKPYEPKV